MVFAVASACGVVWMSDKHKVREDSAIALFWTLGMSIGIICSFLTPGFMTDLPSYLFGNILTIGTEDLLLLGGLTILTVLLYVLFADTIMSVAFDPIFAKTQNMPVKCIEYLMMTLIALTIVATLRLVGIVLAISLLTIPQMTANLFVCRFTTMAWLSVGIGIIYCIAGLVFSYLLNVPSGASIIFVSIVIYTILRLTKRE